VNRHVIQTNKIYTQENNKVKTAVHTSNIYTGPHFEHLHWASVPTIAYHFESGGRLRQHQTHNCAFRGVVCIKLCL